MTKRCYKCGVEYDQSRSIGSLECKTHTSSYNYNIDGNKKKRFQWECCGSSGLTGGCIRIDHSRDEQEFQQIMERPYAFLPFEWTEKTTYPGNIVATYTSKEDLYDDVEIHCAHRKAPFLVDTSNCEYVKSSDQ